MNFIIFNKLTGEILLSGSGPEAELKKISCEENEEKLIVDYSIADIYKNSGKWVDVETKQLIDYGPKPLGCYNLTANGWVRDIETEIVCATEEMRFARNQLLTEMDQVVSNPLRWEEFSESKKQEWMDYRQALLDVPQQSGFPLNIDWPKKPE